MSERLNGSGRGSQPSPVDRLTTIRTTAIDQSSLAVLRQALSDTGWTMDALSEHMDGKDKAYLHRVLSGDKPMPDGFFDALPSDARGVFHKMLAEALGFLVVPHVSPAEARRHLAIGLLNGGLAVALPDRAGQPLKAATTERKKQEIA